MSTKQVGALCWSEEDQRLMIILPFVAMHPLFIAGHMAFNMPWLRILVHWDRCPQPAYPHYINIFQVHNVGKCRPLIWLKSMVAQLPTLSTNESLLLAWFALHISIFFTTWHKMQHITFILGCTMICVEFPLTTIIHPSSIFKMWACSICQFVSDHRSITFASAIISY